MTMVAHVFPTKLPRLDQSISTCDRLDAKASATILHSTQLAALENTSRNSGQTAGQKKNCASLSLLSGSSPGKVDARGEELAPGSPARQVSKSRPPWELE